MIKQQINEQIKELAKEEFTTNIGIIKKGLDIFYKYVSKDIHEFLLENKVEECVDRVMKELDMTEEEVLYLALDTYKAFILNITLAQRLAKVKVGEYVYNFNSMEVKRVYKEVSVHDILEKNRLDLIAEQEAIIDNGIAKAQTILASIDKEKAEIQAKVNKIEGEISKLSTKIALLKAKDILTMKYSERVKNKNEIAKLESESVILMKNLQVAKDELKEIKSKRFFIAEDISDMIKILENSNQEGYYEIDKIKEEYR